MSKEKIEEDWDEIQSWSIKKRLEWLNDCFKKYDKEPILEQGLKFALHCFNIVFEKELSDYWKKDFEKNKNKVNAENEYCEGCKHMKFEAGTNAEYCVLNKEPHPDLDEPEYLFCESRNDDNDE